MTETDGAMAEPPQPSGRPSAVARRQTVGPALGSTPAGPMDLEDLLPRRALPVGAVGVGEHGHYRIVLPLDRGGMGELFVAERLGSAERVVIKRLLADLLDEDKYLAMFRSEADVMGSLQHPHIVRLVDTPSFESSQCLALELVHGRSVQQILARHDRTQSKMPPQIAVWIMIRVLRALDYAHNFSLADGRPLKLVHRDVSPGNILIGYDGAVKLTDFGIAKSQMSLVSTTVGIVKGKARYLAPEQILGEAASPRSDIFSAAAVLAEMLSGVPTFDRQSVPKTLFAIVNGQRPDLSALLPFRATMLVACVDRALMVDSTTRFANAGDFADALERALVELPATDSEAVGRYLAQLFEGQPDPLDAVLSEPMELSADDVEELASEEVALQPSFPLQASAVDEAEALMEETEALSDDATEQRKDPAAALAALAADLADATEQRPRPPTAVLEARASESEADRTAEQPRPASSQRRQPTEVIFRPLSADKEETLDADPPDAQAPRRRAWEELGQKLELTEESPIPVFKKLVLEIPEESLPAAPTSALAPSQAPTVPMKSLPEDVAKDIAKFQKKRVGPWMGLGMGLALGIGVTLALRTESPPPPAPALVVQPPAAVNLTEQVARMTPAEVAALLHTLEKLRPPPPPPSAPAEAVPVGPAQLDILGPKGAKIRLDGKRLGKAPLLGIELTAGAHELELTKGKMVREVEFVVQGGEQLTFKQNLEIKKAP